MFSPQQELGMLAAYNGGEPIPSILQRFGSSESHLFKIRNRYGVAVRKDLPRTSRLGPELEREIIAAYRAGRSLSELGRDYGCCLETIRKILKRHGVERRRRGALAKRFTAEQVAGFAERWAAGESQYSIAKSLGLTKSQIGRLLRDIDQTPEVRSARGAKHGSWKGGRVPLGAGYVGVRLERDDPLREMAHSGGYVLEHRLVVARSLGRPLRQGETVHHINGIKDDNRLENLQLRNRDHGSGKVSRCADCGSHNLVDAPLAEASV